MERWGERIQHRQITFSLAIFFIAWYALQLSVLQVFGEDVAVWWFYFERPPVELAPGLIFAPISHDLSTLTHLGANILLLLAAGGFSEPYIGEKRLFIVVIGLGYLSVYLANLTAEIHSLWILAGVSGGVLSLWAYAGLRMRQIAFQFDVVEQFWSEEMLETTVALVLLLGIPVFFLHQIFLVSKPHSGHLIGLVLGCTFYGLETIFDRVKLVEK